MLYSIVTIIKYILTPHLVPIVNSVDTTVYCLTCHTTENREMIVQNESRF